MSFDPLELIRAETFALADSAEAHLAAAIEHCPGWTVADLARHVHEVQWFWGQVVERRLTNPNDAEPQPELPDDQLLDALCKGADRFVRILTSAEPATPVWTWAPQRDVAFVLRHQVQEAAVHRWDAEHARGRVSTLDAEPAADAVDEFAEFTLPAFRTPSASLPAPVTLEATDISAAWTLVPEADRLVLGPGGGTAELRIRATAFELLLLLYRRLRPRDLERIGDAAAVDRMGDYEFGD